jgi:benzoate/toluate 1,2-dioxygenase reductase subunit
MAKIALNFEDGFTRIIDGLPNETVAESAYRVGINIPLDCADGACGTCKCKSVSGAFDPGNYIDEALTEEEAAEGFALACQMRPSTDIVVNILANTAACKVKVETVIADIIAIESLSSEVYRLVMRPQGDRKISFLPGQYANIEVPGTDHTRSYSFSSQPGSAECKFLIRAIPGGVMSSYLQQQAKVGDALKVTGPVGGFYAREIIRPTLFFAGGTGIAPFFAMLGQFGQEQPAHPIRLYYGVTKEENAVEVQQLEAFTTQLDFQFFTCVSAGDSTACVPGYVTQWITRDHLGEGEYDVYICGPNAMVDAVKDKLEAEAINLKNFYTEKFVPTGATALV